MPLSKGRATRLAVFSPVYGVPSETFIRRHASEIMPGETLAVACELFPGCVAERDVYTLYGQERASSLSRMLNFTNGLFNGRGASKRRVDRLCDFLKELNCEVFLGEYLDASLPFLGPIKQRGMRFFVHAHGYDVSQKFREPAFRKQILQYREADGIITVNDIQGERLIGLGIPPEKIYKIPCGVDIPALERKGVFDGVVRCLAVGRMVGKKAPLCLLEAFRLARVQDSTLVLDYIGDGPLWGKAMAYVEEHGLGEVVALHGSLPVSEVHFFMREADIFIQHSVTDATGDEEGLPVAILEAMAHALPVVATFHTGIPEAVVEGETGFLAREYDHEGMAALLLRLSGSRKMRVCIGNAGRARALLLFSAGREVVDLRNLMFSCSEDGTD